jgi:uncharacterized membrane protein
MKILILMIMLSLASCGNYSEDAPFTVRDIQLSEVNLDFATIKNEILTPHCISCHSQYNSYNGVRREISKIAATVSSNRMPKNAPALPSGLKSLLNAWIDAGAPQFPGQGPVGPEPVKLTADWKSISENIIAPKCMVCHNPQGQAKFLDLTTRQGIFDSRNRTFADDQKLIDFETPENSYLVAVLQDEFEPMPPPPPFSNFGKLNAEEIAIITKWIQLGLPQETK